MSAPSGGVQMQMSTPQTLRKLPGNRVPPKLTHRSLCELHSHTWKRVLTQGALGNTTLHNALTSACITCYHPWQWLPCSCEPSCLLYYAVYIHSLMKSSQVNHGKPWTPSEFIYLFIVLSFQFQLTFTVALISGAQYSDRHLCNLWRDCPPPP